MSFRRSIIGLLGVVVLSVAACASAGAPSGSASLPSIAIPSGALPSVALEGFCADFAGKVEAAWPNIDASTASTLTPLITQWADKPEMASVKSDVTTIAAWITTTASGGTVATPPPDVTTAFDHLKAFADTNC
jgi:hypothetical protein